jgi:predicted RNA-binding Zn-ribbon protein involved in translation (DUF1610 family)
MFIKEIISQFRRDFHAIYKCEHCGCEVEKPGYDDDYFHNHVVPNMSCPECGKIAGSDYKPRNTKYDSWEVV